MGLENRRASGILRLGDPLREEVVVVGGEADQRQHLPVTRIEGDDNACAGRANLLQFLPEALLRYGLEAEIEREVTLSPGVVARLIIGRMTCSSRCPQNGP